MVIFLCDCATIAPDCLIEQFVYKVTIQFLIVTLIETATNSDLGLPSVFQWD